MRVVGGQGESLGIMPTAKALKLAKEQGVDLVEIAPTAKPPVVKIISFDKLRYQEEKQLRKQKQAQKSLELKQVQISLKEGKNDLAIKAGKIDNFLEKGHKVEVRLFLRGREKANKDWALNKLDEFLTMITKQFIITAEPKFMGRGFTTQITKK